MTGAIGSPTVKTATRDETEQVVDALVTLYQRHGFVVVCKIQVGDAPPIFPMLREPR